MRAICPLLLLAFLCAAGAPAAAVQAPPGLEPQAGASSLARGQVRGLDVVAVQRPGSDIVEILLSLPPAKHDYSAADFQGAAVAVRAVTARVERELAPYGAMVGYSDNHSAPTLSVTVLAEHARQVLPQVLRHWRQAPMPAAAWARLLVRDAQREQSPAEQVEQQLLGLWQDAPGAMPRQDPQRFAASRTLLVVGGPWSLEQLRALLGGRGPATGNLLPAAARPALAAAPVLDLPACQPAQWANAAGPVTVFVPVSTVPVSAPNWPASRLAMAVAGTGYDSRMNRDLRQEKGWAYGAGMPVYYRPTHTVGLARTRVQPAHAQAAALRLEAVLASLRSDAVAPAELAQAKRVLVENYWSNRENLVHEVAYVADFVGAGMTLAQFDAYPQALQQVRAAEVQAFSAQVAGTAVAAPAQGAPCRIPLAGLAVAPAQ